MNGKTFADVVKDIRSKVKPEDSNAGIRSIRKTISGEVLFEFNKATEKESRENFNKSLRGALGHDGEVKVLMPRTTLEIRDMESDTTISDIAEVMGLDGLEDTLQGMNNNLVVAGDFNAQSVEWNMAQTDSRGRHTMEMTTRLGLMVINVAHFTKQRLIFSIFLQKWAFVARFCFLSEKGDFHFVITYSQKKYGVQNLLFYYDTEDQWPSAYRPGLTCTQRMSYLNKSQIVPLTKGTPVCEFKKGSLDSNEELMECRGDASFRTARERWWYLAVSNCNSTKGLSIEFKFSMTNGPPGDFWHHHFSADELYILPILIAFLLAYICIIIAIVICTVELKERQLYHTTYKLFVVAVVFQELGIVLQCAAYIRFALNGIGYPRTRTLGQIFESTSEVVFLLLMLLLAKGYTVTRGRLRIASSIKLTIFMCLYCVMYCVLFIYEKLFFDPGKVLYLYESPAGYGLILLRVVAWWMFVYSVVFTLKHYPEKAVFYYPFNIVGTIWFVSGPVFILITNGVIDKWVRESVVCGVLHFITLCGHVLFLVLTLPMTANKVFPYHVRTSQVGVLFDPGPDGTYPFSHHVYDPSAPRSSGVVTSNVVEADWATDVPVELFSISRIVNAEAAVIPIKSYRTNGMDYNNHRRESSSSEEEGTVNTHDQNHGNYGNHSTQ
ncbi:transmembrane protein 145 [Anabrus simplex]|uniref:transmembrane protein 145 n=1 Tax=Anabrus simplex TaxID=316456 RepID=UPI0035A2C3B3